MVAARQGDLLSNLLLSFEYGAAEVASADAEFDRDVALLTFSVDERSARHKLDRGNIAQRYRHDTAASGVRRADRDAADCIEALAIFRGKPDDHRKIAVASFLIQITRCLPSYRGRNRRVDIAGSQPVASRPGSVDLNLDRRLTKRVEHGEIGDPRYRTHGLLDFRGGLFQNGEIVAEQL